MNYWLIETNWLNQDMANSEHITCGLKMNETTMRMRKEGKKDDPENGKLSEHHQTRMSVFHQAYGQHYLHSVLTPQRIDASQMGWDETWCKHHATLKQKQDRPTYEGQTC